MLSVVKHCRQGDAKTQAEGAAGKVHNAVAGAKDTIGGTARGARYAAGGLRSDAASGRIACLRREEIDVIGAFTAAAEAVLGGSAPRRRPASASGPSASRLTPAGRADLGEAADRAK
jgi:hypothetical protein